MKINCLIIDDEPAAIRVVEGYLEKFDQFVVKGKCKTAFEAINQIESEHIDVIFLDINMPGLSGIQLIKSLRKPPKVVITTAYRDYAVESFDLDVIDYLHKPFSFERFYKAIQKVDELFTWKNRVKSENDDKHNNVDSFIFIKADKKYYKIEYNKLLFIESMGDYCKFITLDEVFVSYMTLKKLVDILPDYFLRIHKSFIINYNKVDIIEGNTIKILKNELPIGYSYKADFQKKLEEH